MQSAKWHLEPLNHFNTSRDFETRDVMDITLVIRTKMTFNHVSHSKILFKLYRSGHSHLHFLTVTAKNAHS